MKINGALPLHQLEVEKAQSGSRNKGSARAAAGSERVELSDSARFIQGAREEAGGMEQVRPEEVARARAEIAAGTLESDEAIEAAADALLAGSLHDGF